MRTGRHAADTIGPRPYRGGMWKRLVVVVAIVAGACSTPGTVAPGALPPLDPAGFEQLLAQLDRPAVVNVWASWCVPCRSEAPLLREAHSRFGDEVAFIGIDVQDDQDSAVAFIAEFGLEFDNYFDRNRSIPAAVGGIGVPVTYFVDRSGTIIDIHSGIIVLAIGIDEILSR